LTGLIAVSYWLKGPFEERKGRQAPKGLGKSNERNRSKMRNIKILGLALFAMFSMSAVMAVSASADTLTAGAYPAQLTGTADEEGGFEDVFTTTAGTVKCKDSKYDATISGPVTTAGKIEVTPTYPSCTGFGFPATIHHKSCKYEFKVLAGTKGTVNIECATAGDEITITAIGAGTTKCTVHVKPQTDIPGTITYKNIVGGITADISLEKIHYTHTAGTGVGACTSGTGEGKIVARAIFTAETDTGGTPTPLSLILS
jgi:hypothetical protein